LVLGSFFQGMGLALARFANLLGGDAGGEENPVVAELLRGWSRLERDGAIVAELTYNHGFRTANAGLRPAIFRHEIELPGERGSPGAEIIPLGDLVVRWNAARERFVLRSIERRVEVLPVINSGVNPVGVISFLVYLGQQGFQPVGYFPGFSVPGITRWPRIVCGRTVVFRERWEFGEGEWPEPARGGRPVDDADYFIDVARWRRRNLLPRHVFVHSSADPKPRYVDLEAPPFVESLQRALAAAPASPEIPRDLHVTEMLPDPDGLWVRNGAGRFATEFLVHFQGPEPHPAPPAGA
jgi:hypothetical protein